MRAKGRFYFKTHCDCKREPVLQSRRERQRLNAIRWVWQQEGKAKKWKENGKISILYILSCLILLSILGWRYRLA